MTQGVTPYQHRIFVAFATGCFLLLFNSAWAEQANGENWNDPGVTVTDPNVWDHRGVVVTSPNGDAFSDFSDHAPSCAISTQCDANGHCVQRKLCD